MVYLIGGGHPSPFMTHICCMKSRSWMSIKCLPRRIITLVPVLYNIHAISDLSERVVEVLMCQAPLIRTGRDAEIELNRPANSIRDPYLLSISNIPNSRYPR